MTEAERIKAVRRLLEIRKGELYHNIGVIEEINLMLYKIQEKSKN